MSKNRMDINNPETESLLNDLISESEDDFEKTASDDIDPSGISRDQLLELAKINEQLGIIRAKAFCQQMRKEAAMFVEAMGLDKVAAPAAGNAAGLKSTPSSEDVLSMVLKWLFNKINVFTRIPNTKQGTSGVNESNIDPDSHPWAKTNTSITDDAHPSKNKETSTGPFGLRKGNRK